MSKVICDATERAQLIFSPNGYYTAVLASLAPGHYFLNLLSGTRLFSKLCDKVDERTLSAFNLGELHVILERNHALLKFFTGSDKEECNNLPEIVDRAAKAVIMSKIIPKLVEGLRLRGGTGTGLGISAEAANALSQSQEKDSASELERLRAENIRLTAEKRAYQANARGGMSASTHSATLRKRPPEKSLLNPRQKIRETKQNKFASSDEEE